MGGIPMCRNQEIQKRPWTVTMDDVVDVFECPLADAIDEVTGHRKCPKQSSTANQAVSD